jgi:hypothetical protein
MKLSEYVPSFGGALFILSVVAILNNEVNVNADPGLGWHLATGNYILSTGHIPYIDPFLSTSRPWISDQWGMDVILALFYKLGSWTALTSLVGVTFITTFFVVLYKGLLKSSNSAILSYVACIGAYKVSQIHYIARPVFASFLLFALFFLQISKIAKNASHNSSKKESPLKLSDWVFIPLILAFWCNIHPSFIIGLITLLMWPAAIIISSYIFSIENELFSRHCKSISLFILLCITATLCNPYGLNLHLSILDLGKSDYFMNYHIEWMSPDFDKIEGKITEFFVVSLLVAAYIVRPEKSSYKIFQGILLLPLAHGSLQATRMLPYFIIAIAVPWTETIAKLINQYRHTIIIRKIPALDTFEKRLIPYRVSIFACLLLATLVPVLRSTKEGNKNLYQPSQITYPYGAVNFLTKHHNQQNTAVVLAPAHWGGFLTFKSNGLLKPVLDDRNTLIGETLYKQFHKSEKNYLEMRKLALETKATYLLLPKSHSLNCPLNTNTLSWLTNTFEDEESIAYQIN